MSGRKEGDVGERSIEMWGWGRIAGAPIPCRNGNR